MNSNIKNLISIMLFTIVTLLSSYFLQLNEISFVSKLHPIFNSHFILNYLFYPIIILSIIALIIIFSFYSEPLYNIGFALRKAILVSFIVTIITFVVILFLYNKELSNSKIMTLTEAKHTNSTQFIFPGSYAKLILPNVNIKSIKGYWGADFYNYPVISSNIKENIRFDIDTGEIIGDNWVQLFELEHKIPKINISKSDNFDWSENRNGGYISFNQGDKILKSIKPGFLIFKIPSHYQLYNDTLSITGRIHISYPTFNEMSKYYTKDTMININAKFVSINKSMAIDKSNYRHILKLSALISYVCYSLLLIIVLRLFSFSK